MTSREWFGSVTTQAALDPSISVTAKAVYLVLAVHADYETGECFISNTKTGQYLGVSRVTVVRAMNQLEEAGLVKRTPRYRKGHQTSNCIVLLDVQSARRKRSVYRS